jgi:hypothetical protein
MTSDSRMTPAERAEFERRIACPVLWCDGRWLEHGGDGQPPELWLHEDESGMEIAPGAVLTRAQEGSAPVVWSLAVDGNCVLDFDDPRALARRLRLLADAVSAITDREGRSPDVDA